MNNGFYSFPKNKTTESIVTTIQQQEDFIKHAIDNCVPSFEGEVVEGIIDSAVSQFQVVYLNTTWRRVDQTTDSTTYLLGIYLGDNRVLLEGSVVVASVSNPIGPYVDSLVSTGTLVYLRDGTSAGETSCTIPGGKYVRDLGHCYYQSSNYPSYYIMKFKPSSDWYYI